MGVFDEVSAAGLSQGQWFATTHWSVVLTAKDAASPDALTALDKLCRTYWFPLYAYVRRQGYDPNDAMDFTQGFFARLLEKNYLDQVDRQKGRFRSFLLASLRHYLSDERDRANAAKRGGGQTFISLDDHTLAEERYKLEPADDASPDKIFDQRWAHALLEAAQRRLRAEYAAAGKAELHDALARTGSRLRAVESYAVLAKQWGMTEAAVKSAAHRLRQRYHELVREEVAQTVASPSALDEELRYLITVISS